MLADSPPSPQLSGADGEQSRSLRLASPPASPTLASSNYSSSDSYDANSEGQSSARSSGSAPPASMPLAAQCSDYFNRGVAWSKQNPKTVAVIIVVVLLTAGARQY